MTDPTRPYAHLSLSALIALARGSTTPAALVPIAPPTPDDALRTAAAAAGIATTHNQDTDA